MNKIFLPIFLIFFVILNYFFFYNSSIDFKKNNLDAAKILTEFLIQFSKDMDFYIVSDMPLYVYGYYREFSEVKNRLHQVVQNWETGE